MSISDRRAAALLLVSLLVSGCSGSPWSTPPYPTRAQRSNAAVLTAHVVFKNKRLNADDVQRDGAGAPYHGLRVRGSKGGTYWFTADARVSRYDDMVVFRDYGTTFIFRKQDVDIRDNASGLSLDAAQLPEEDHASNAATTMKSGHIGFRSGKTICPECLQVQPPRRSGRAATRAPRIYLPGTYTLCDSDAVPGSCDVCPDAFSGNPCCDLSADSCDMPDEDAVGGADGYYDAFGNWVPDQCSALDYDASEYGTCSQMSVLLPRITFFRSPGVQRFTWYRAGSTQFKFRNPYSSYTNPPVSSFYDMHVWDFIAGNADVPFQPVPQGYIAKPSWCVNSYTAPTPFESEIVDVIAAGYPTAAYSARLATPSLGDIPTDSCP